MTEEQDSFARLMMRLEPASADPHGAYIKCRQRMIKYFQWKGCEDAENLADETLVRLVRKDREGVQIEAENPYSYVYGIAAHVVQEYLRHKKRDEDIRQNWKPSSRTNAPYFGCKRQCFERLPLDKRELLLRYYGSSDSAEEIAEKMGISLNSLRLRVCRIKLELQECYKQCRGD